MHVGELGGISIVIIRTSTLILDSTGAGCLEAYPNQ